MCQVAILILFQAYIILPHILIFVLPKNLRSITLISIIWYFIVFKVVSLKLFPFKNYDHGVGEDRIILISQIRKY